MEFTMSIAELTKMIEWEISERGSFPSWEFFKSETHKDSKRILAVDTITGQTVRCDDFFKDKG